MGLANEQFDVIFFFLFFFFVVCVDELRMWKWWFDICSQNVFFFLNGKACAELYIFYFWYERIFLWFFELRNKKELKRKFKSFIAKSIMVWSCVWQLSHHFDVQLTSQQAPGTTNSLHQHHPHESTSTVQKYEWLKIQILYFYLFFLCHDFTSRYLVSHITHRGKTSLFYLNFSHHRVVVVVVGIFGASPLLNLSKLKGFGLKSLVLRRIFIFIFFVFFLVFPIFTKLQTI